MSVPFITPPLDLQLQVIFEQPYVTSAAQVLICRSIRDIDDYAALDIDPYAEVYQTAGITQTRFAADVENGVKVAIFVDVNTDLVFHVPTSFIVSFKAVSIVPYKNVGVTLDVGLLPVDVDIETLKVNLRTTVRETIGRDAYVAIDYLPLASVVNKLDHKTLETARLANLKYRPTAEQSLLVWIKRCEDLENENRALREQIELLAGV